MSQTRICHITTVHTTFDVRIFHKQCRSLADAGYEVYLIAKAEADQVREGVRIKAIPPDGSRLKKSIMALKIAKSIKADIYHFHDPELLPAGVLLKIFTPAKIVYDVHEDVAKHALGKSWWRPWKRNFFAFILNTVEWLSHWFFDLIICAEDSYLRKFRKRRVVIHNYPLLVEWNESSSRTKHADLIYVGTVRRKRGLFEMIKAVELLSRQARPVSLEIIGPFFPPALRQETENLLAQSQLSEIIRITGALDHTQIFEHIDRARIGLALLHPDSNYIHSLPTKMFEYMMFGLPVLVSDFPLWREIVDRERCGLCVDAQNPEAVAGAVKKMLGDVKQMEQMGRQGRRAVREKYNWQIEEKRLIECYQNLT